MTQEELYDRIEAYLEGTFSPQEHQEFEQEIDADPELKQEVELHRQLQGELGESDVTIFRNIVVEEKQKMKPLGKTIALGRFQILSIAASFALLITAGYFIFFQTNPSPQDLFNQYYVLPDLQITQGSLRGEDDMNLDSAIILLNLANQLATQNNFPQAIVTADSLLGISVELDQIILLRLGIWQLSGDNPEEALAFFNQVNNQSEAIQWYKALTYLELDQLDQIPGLLQPLTEYANPRQEAAQKLLRQVQRMLP